MTTYFVSAVDGSNANNGTTWALAKQTVAGALAIPPASGDTIVVDNAGTFTANAAITWTLINGNISIISVTRSGTVSFTPSAGATESVGTGNANWKVTQVATSNLYCFGMTFLGGTGGSSAIITLMDASNPGVSEFASCLFNFPGNNSNNNLFIGSQTRGCFTRLKDCTVTASGSRAGALIIPNGGTIEIINPTISTTGATKPAVLFQSPVSFRSITKVRDADLSGYATSGGAYVSVTNLSMAAIEFENLKLSATPSLTSGTFPAGDGYLLVRNCDSGDTINTFQYQNAYGTLTQNTSIYVGADGQFNSAGISWQIVTTSSANQYAPFVTPYIEKWTTSTSLQTSEVQITYDNATPLTDQDIWSEIEFAGSASFPNYTYQTNRNAQPITGSTANQTSSSATWTGTSGFTNPQKQQLQNALTAAEVGLLRAKVYVGKATTTLYVSPDIEGIS